MFPRRTSLPSNGSRRSDISLLLGISFFLQHPSLAAFLTLFAPSTSRPPNFASPAPKKVREKKNCERAKERARAKKSARGREGGRGRGGRRDKRRTRAVAAAPPPSSPSSSPSVTCGAARRRVHSDEVWLALMRASIALMREQVSPDVYSESLLALTKPAARRGVEFW